MGTVWGMAVYMIQAGIDGPVKIGKSTDVKSRHSMLQAAHPFELILIREIEGYGKVERWLHERFATCRLRGEWFSFHPDMLTVEPDIDEPAPPPRRSQKSDESLTPLARWLRDNGKTQAMFAGSVGTSQSYIAGLCAGDRLPSLRLAQKIAVVTAGQVMPEDFFQVEPQTPEQAA